MKLDLAFLRDWIRNPLHNVTMGFEVELQARFELELELEVVPPQIWSEV